MPEPTASLRKSSDRFFRGLLGLNPAGFRAGWGGEIYSLANALSGAEPAGNNSITCLNAAGTTVLSNPPKPLEMRGDQAVFHGLSGKPSKRRVHRCRFQVEINHASLRRNAIE